MRGSQAKPGERDSEDQASRAESNYIQTFHGKWKRSWCRRQKTEKMRKKTETGTVSKTILTNHGISWTRN